MSELSLLKFTAMRTTHLYILIILLFTACLDDDDLNNGCIDANGPVLTEERTLSTFKSIELEGIGNILVTQGAPQSVQIVTNQNILSLIETRVVNEELQIDLEPCVNGPLDQLDFLITIPDIEKLELNGVGNIIGQNDFDVDELELELVGVGEVMVSGTADILEVNSSGVGNVMAFDLIAETVEVFLSGAGNVEVTAQVDLDVTISGSGNVSYKGDPSIDANISGSGNLIDAN